MTPKAFIEKMRPGADECEDTEGIPAAFTIAQGALESAWGSSGLCVQANNIFGVKADKSWKGRIYTKSTKEFLNGKWVMIAALWRAYDTWAECLLDHAKFFKVNKRYAKALETNDPEEFARRVAAAGYATDPKYADKLISVMKKYVL